MKYIIALIIIGGAIVGIYEYTKKETVAPVTHEPYALWCDGERAYFSQGGTNCFSIDREGYKIGSSSEVLGVRFFGSIATTTNFSLITKVIDDIKRFTTVYAVSIKENDQFVIHAIVGDILFPEVDGASTSLKNIEVFLQDKQNKRFDYIDVRHGSSVFYKIASTTHARTGN